METIVSKISSDRYEHPSLYKKMIVVEMGCRILMVAILLTAGTSKLMSDGGFVSYYSALFQSDLRIVLPKLLVDTYLVAIPFLEIAIGILLAFPSLKKIGIACWYGFMLSLLVGHYVLQDWSSVNQLLDYFFLGFIFYLLPGPNNWPHTDSQFAYDDRW